MKRGDIKTGRVISSKPSQNKSFKELGEEYLRNAEVRGLSEYTIKSYKYQIGYILEFGGEELTCKDISLNFIEQYIQYLKESTPIFRIQAHIWVLTSTGIRTRDVIPPRFSKVIL